MQTLHHKMFSVAFSLIAVLLFASSAASQEQPRVAVIATRGPHPVWEGNAAGKTQPFVLSNDDLRTAVLTQPFPEIWLEFAESKRQDQSPRTPTDEKENVIQVLLPADAKEIMESFWDKSLEFDFKEVFDRPKTAQEAIDRDQALVNYIAETAKKLEKIEIATPEGTRKISFEEARRLLFFLRKTSGNLVQSVKQ